MGSSQFCFFISLKYIKGDFAGLAVIHTNNT